MVAKAVKQSKSRADAKLDASVVADLDFFAGQNRTKKHKAAILLAEDELTGEAIAKKLGIARSTLYEWRDEPEFQQVVGDYHGQIIAEALKLPIARKHERVKVLNTLHVKALESIEQRAKSNEPEDDAAAAAMSIFGGTPPEAATGLFAAKQSISASGRIVTDYVFDHALVKEIRELQKQAATELGQWTEKTEVEQLTTTMVQIIGDDWEGE